MPPVHSEPAAGKIIWFPVLAAVRCGRAGRQGVLWWWRAEVPSRGAGQQPALACLHPHHTAAAPYHRSLCPHRENLASHALISLLGRLAAPAAGISFVAVVVANDWIPVLSSSPAVTIVFGWEVILDQFDETNLVAVPICNIMRNKAEQVFRYLLVFSCAATQHVIMYVFLFFFVCHIHLGSLAKQTKLDQTFHLASYPSK